MGWLSMQRQVEPLPEDPGPAEEGTAAHWVVPEILCGHPVAVGDVAPNGITVTEEMLDGADLMATAIGDDRSSLHIEQPARGTITWGTLDAWRLSHSTLDVWDYKFGYRFVPVWKNPQLLLYVESVLSALGIPDDKNLTIRVHVVQPRYYGPEGKVRSWLVSRASFDREIGRLKSAASANRAGGECTPGGYCIDCRARHACSALQAPALSVPELARQPIPAVLSDSALVRERRLLREAQALLAARIAGLDQQALAILHAGRSLSGLQIGRTQSREVWKDSPDAVLRLGKLFGVDLAKPAATVTPKQAVKIGLPAEILRGRTKTPMGTEKLIDTTIDSLD